MKISPRKSYFLFTVLIICMSSQYSFAQLFVNGRNVNAMDSVQVIELITIDNILYGIPEKRGWYSVNFGQIKYDDNRWDQKITDAANNVVKFANPVSVVNYILSKDWDILSVTTYHVTSTDQDDNGTIFYKYIFNKKPTTKVN